MRRKAQRIMSETHVSRWATQGRVRRFERWQHWSFLKAGGLAMKSSVIKRSVKIDGRTTSVSLEDAFWSALKEIARGRSMTLAELVTSINTKREQPNLSSGIRVFVLDHFHIRINKETDAENALPNVEPVQQAKSA
jgi:predicted DNA-binding ribbon-helix-helix protein